MIYERPNRRITRVFIHCTASNRDTTIKQVRRWHTDPKPRGQGWSDVAYHFLIRYAGTVQEGRPLRRIPAAQKGHNTGSIAICLNGLDRFTIEQIRALQDLCLEIDDAHDDPRLSFWGHNRVANKACPVINIEEVLRLDAFGFIDRETRE